MHGIMHALHALDNLAAPVYYGGKNCRELAPGMIVIKILHVELCFSV